MTGPLSEQARAKVNLSLHVLGRRADGLHELESLVVFADLADVLTLQPGGAFSLNVSGPTAQVIGPADGNLVLKAERVLGELVPGLKSGAFDLSKQLPVAGGIGGGSADAAATLRLLARANGLSLDDPRISEAAQAIGADVLVCLESTPRMMRGTGQRLGPPLRLPAMHAVLVNPGVPSPTAEVFTELGLKPGQTVTQAAHANIESAADAATLTALIANLRNELEPAAIRRVPEIADVLDQLMRQHRCALARMSGSGATCFGLFPTMSSAFQAVRSLRRFRSNWWVQPVVLGGQ